MPVTTEDPRVVVPLSEMFGKLLEMRLECMDMNMRVRKFSLRDAAEAAYAEAFKECEDVGDSHPGEGEAEVKKEFTDRYIYEQGFYDGIFTVQHTLNICVSGMEGVKPSEGLMLPRYVENPNIDGKGHAGQGDTTAQGPVVGKIQYKVHDDADDMEQTMWAKAAADGVILVDAEYLAEFLKNYPDAVEVEKARAVWPV